MTLLSAICLIFFITIPLVESISPTNPVLPSYFDVQLDRFEQLYADPEYGDWSGIKVRKVNKTRSIIGEMKFFKPIGNDMIMEGLSYKKQGNEYRLMPYHRAKEGFCDVLASESNLKIILNLICIENTFCFSLRLS